MRISLSLKNKKETDTVEEPVADAETDKKKPANVPAKKKNPFAKKKKEVGGGYKIADLSTIRTLRDE